MFFHSQNEIKRRNWCISIFRPPKTEFITICYQQSQEKKKLQGSEQEGRVRAPCLSFGYKSECPGNIGRRRNCIIILSFGLLKHPRCLDKSITSSPGIGHKFHRNKQSVISNCRVLLVLPRFQAMAD